MKKVYLSGPMDGLPNNNKVEFQLAEAYYRDLGFEVVNPHRLSEALDLYNSETGLNPPTYCEYLLNDLNALIECDMMVLLKDFKRSFGCSIEIAFAHKAGIPMYHAISDKPAKFEYKGVVVEAYDKLIPNGRIGEVMDTITDGSYV